MNKIPNYNKKYQPFAVGRMGEPLPRGQPFAVFWRKYRKLFFALLIILLFLFSLPYDRAVADDSYRAELNENILEQIEKLDTSALEEYVNGLGILKGESIKDRIVDYIAGGGEFNDFFELIGSLLFSNLKNLLSPFACITAMVLLSGLITALNGHTIGASTSNTVFLATYTAVLIPVLAVLTECFGMIRESVSSMEKQMQIVFPLVLTLMAASGGSVSAAIYKPAVAFLSTTIVSAVSTVVLPVTIALIVFSAIGKISPELNTDKFSAFLKSINKWIIGIGVSVFGMFFTVQGITAATYDGITKRAARYAISSGVPIVGGFLSGGFDLALAGSVLIKNSIGSLGLVLLMVALSEPLMILVATNLFLRFTAAVTQPIGDRRISDFLGATADNLNYGTASLLFVAFLYFVVIVLMICSSEVLL